MSNKAMTWAVDARVKGSHKLVLMLLAEAHNGHTGACFPSQEWIEEKSGLADSTVAACIKELEDWGFLTRHTKALGRGKGSRRDFELHLQILDPQIIEVYDTGFRPLENQPLDPQISGGLYKDEPESNRKEPEDTREKIAFDHYNQTATRVGWVTHSKLTDALRKPLSARIDEHGLEMVKAFIDAMAGLEWTSKGFRDKPDFRATLMFITRPRTFAEHFDKLVTSRRVPPPADAATQFEFVRGEAIDRRLVFCFRVYGSGDGWMGARYGWPDLPDRPEAEGLYAEQLYAEFGVKRPGRAA